MHSSATVLCMFMGHLGLCVCASRTQKPNGHPCTLPPHGLGTGSDPKFCPSQPSTTLTSPHCGHHPVYGHHGEKVWLVLMEPQPISSLPFPSTPLVPGCGRSCCAYFVPQKQPFPGNNETRNKWKRKQETSSLRLSSVGLGHGAR